MTELRPHYIDVDLKKNTQYNVPVVTQNDTATHFIIRVTDDGLSDPELLDAYQEITMTSQRPDGESFYLTGTRIPGTNEIEFHLGTDETAFSGSVLASLQFYLVEDASRYTSAQFRYDVKKDLTKNYTPTQREETLVEVVLRDGPGVIQEAREAIQDADSAIERLDEVTEENKTIFREPVATFAALSTTYPNPEHGTTVRVTSEAASYRYSDGTWVKTDEYNPTAIDQVTAQLADKVGREELENVKSGTPKGVFNTLADLIAAYPQGSEDIYLVAEDGNWYFWNGENWESGGVYQAAASEFRNMLANSNVPASFEIPAGGRIQIRNNGEIRYFASFSTSYQTPYVISGNKYFSKFELQEESTGELAKTTRLMYEDGTNTEFASINPNNNGKYTSMILTAEYTGLANITVGVTSGGLISRKNQMLVDLTQLFGKGNEPSIEEFERLIEIFPNRWFDTVNSFEEMQKHILRQVTTERNSASQNQFVGEDGKIYDYGFETSNGHLVFQYEEAK